MISSSLQKNDNLFSSSAFLFSLVLCPTTSLMSSRCLLRHETKDETVSVPLATPWTDLEIAATSPSISQRGPVCEQRVSIFSFAVSTSLHSASSSAVCAFVMAFCSLIASTSPACSSRNRVSTRARSAFSVFVSSLTHVSVAQPDNSPERRSSRLAIFAETTRSTCALTS